MNNSFVRKIVATGRARPQAALYAALCLALGSLVLVVACAPVAPPAPTAAPTPPAAATQPPAVAAATPQAAAGAARISLRIAHDSSPDHPYQVGVQRFLDVVRQKTNGEIDGQIFPSAQLGDERTTIEGMRIGTVGAAVSSSAPLSSFSQKIDLLNMPFLARDLDHNFRIVEGPAGQAIAQDLETKAGVKVIGWFYVGSRNVWNKVRPINVPEDLVGLKIRTQQSPVQVDTFNALGAQATPMSFGELYTALQTGVVDGADNDPVDVLTEKFYEVTKYYSLTGHFQINAPFMISKRVWDTLTPAQQAAVMDAGREAQAAERKAYNDLAGSALDQIQQRGLIVNRVPDIAPFQQKVQPVYQKYQDQIGRELFEMAARS